MKKLVFTALTSLCISQFCYSQSLPNEKSRQIIRPATAPIELEISGGQQHEYRFSLSANQFANVVINQHGADIVARIFAANGQIIGIIDSEKSLEGGEKIELVAGTAGDYKIEIKTALPKANTGKYSIRLVETREATANEKLLDEARRQFYEAWRLSEAGKNDKAFESASRALKIQEGISEVSYREVAASLSLLGILCRNKNDLPQGEIFLQRAADIIEKNSGAENLNYAAVLQELGRIQHNKGDYQRAEQLSKRALSIREKIAGEESLAAADSLFSLGLLYRVMNDIPQAEQKYLQVLAIRRKVLGDENLDVAAIQNNLGFLYYTVGDYKSADPLYRDSAAVKEKILGADHPSVALTLTNQGLLEWKKGDYQKAESYFQRALNIYEKASGYESNGVASCLHNLGIVYKETGNFSKGEDYYKRALEIWEKIFGKDNERTAIAVSSLGILYRAAGDFRRAEQFHLRELAIFEKAFGQNHPETAISLNHLARLYAEKGDIKRSLEYQKRVVFIEEKNISLSLSIGSERQKIAFFTTQLQKPDRIISLHARLAPDNNEARELAAAVILGRKGRIQDALSENLAALRRFSTPENRALIDRYNDISTRLSRLVLNGPQNLPVKDYQDQIRIFEEEREQIEREISRRSQGTYLNSQPVTLEAIRQVIPPDAALIEFAVYRPFEKKNVDNKDVFGEPRYIVYIIRNQGEVRWVELGSAEEINRGIEEMRKSLRDPNNSNTQKFARDVDKKVMQPVRALLGDAKRLLISPDGELNLIPFEALVDERGSYLVENYSFSYLTSGRDLLGMRQPRANKNKPVIIADPLFGASGNNRAINSAIFAPLSGTLLEARLIRGLFPESSFLTGSAATETALKQLVAPRILHIATHGFFLSNEEAANTQTANRGKGLRNEVENPLLRAGLALADANKGRDADSDDGILTALEATGLNLWGTKLVVLSACDTGLGEVKNGEGVYGLRRSFTLAGTEALVMSLWAVSDRVTHEVMTNYYKNLKNGEGRGESLRQVQLQMLRKPNRRHPFYWAAFIQSGEWANLDGVR